MLKDTMEYSHLQGKTGQRENDYVYTFSILYVKKKKTQDQGNRKNHIDDRKTFHYISFYIFTPFINESFNYVSNVAILSH